MQVAVVQDGIVVNVVELHDEWPNVADHQYRWTPPDGHQVVSLAQHPAAGIGCTWNGKGFSANPATLSVQAAMLMIST